MFTKSKVIFAALACVMVVALNRTAPAQTPPAAFTTNITVGVQTLTLGRAFASHAVFGVDVPGTGITF